MAEAVILLPEQPAPAARATRTVKQAVLRDVFLLGGSRYLVFAVDLFVSIVQKRLLGPYAVGVWQLLSIARQYLSYGDLGVARGAEQALPPMYARHDPSADRLRDVSYTATLGLTAVVNLAFFAGSFLRAWPVDPLVLLGLRVMALLALVESAANLMEVSALRSHNRFDLVSLQVLGSELLFAALSIPAVWLWRVPGLLAAVAASLLFKLAFMRLTTGEQARVRWDWRIVSALWRMGFPVTVFVVLFKTFDTLDRLLLLRVGSLETLGFYSIGTMATVFLGHLPLAISQVFFPRTMVWAAGADADTLGRYLRQAQLGIFVVMASAVGACYLGMPPLVRMALPNFTPGIPALKLGVLSGLFVGLVHLPMQYQMAFNHRWRLVAVAAVVSMVCYGAGFALLRRAGTAEQMMLVAAGCRVAGYGLLWAVITWWTRHGRRLRTAAALRGHTRELAGMTAYVMALLVAMDRWMPSASGLWAIALDTVMRAALFAAALWPVIRYVDRRTGLVQTVRGAWFRFKVGPA